MYNIDRRGGGVQKSYTRTDPSLIPLKRLFNPSAPSHHNNFLYSDHMLRMVKVIICHVAAARGPLACPSYNNTL